jgi:hypothetical protein
MKTGVYQHFKGGLYYVVGMGKHSETQEDLVVYRDSKGEFWLRPISMFNEHVEKDGYNGPRFKLMRETTVSLMTPEMLMKA